MLWTERSTSHQAIKWKRQMAPFQQLQQEETSSIYVVMPICILEKTDSHPRASQHHRVFSLTYDVYCSYAKSCYYRFRDKDCISSRKFSSCKIYFACQCSHGNFVERTVEDILQRDAVSRVRKTVHIGWYTRSRSLPSDRATQRSCP